MVSGLKVLMGFLVITGLIFLTHYQSQRQSICVLSLVYGKRVRLLSANVSNANSLLVVYILLRLSVDVILFISANKKGKGSEILDILRRQVTLVWSFRLVSLFCNAFGFESVL